MQGARARQRLLAAVPRRPRRRSSDRRAIRRVAAALCLMLALYCLLAAAVGLAQTAAAEPDARPPLQRSRLPLLIPLIFLVFLVVTAAVVRRGRPPAAGLPMSRPRTRPPQGRPD